MSSIQVQSTPTQLTCRDHSGSGLSLSRMTSYLINEPGSGFRRPAVRQGIDYQPARPSESREAS